MSAPRHRTPGLLALPVLVAALALAPAPAGAQSAARSEEDCARLPSPQEEVACLRAALAASQEALAAAKGEQQPVRPAPPPPQDAPPAPAPLVRADPAPAERWGDEQVARRDTAQSSEGARERPEALAATVTDFRTDRTGLLVMQLDNGQIWRQEDRTGGPVPLADNPMAGVEITRSGFGGYRMSFPELGRRIAVSRLR